MAIPRPREWGLRRGENFWLRLTQPACSVRVSPSAFALTCVLLLQLKVIEDEKNSNKRQLDDTSKQLSDRTAAEAKAKETVNKLTTEKVQYSIFQSVPHADGLKVKGNTYHIYLCIYAPLSVLAAIFQVNLG